MHVNFATTTWNEALTEGIIFVVTHKRLVRMCSVQDVTHVPVHSPLKEGLYLVLRVALFLFEGLYPTVEFVVRDLEGLHCHGLETCDAPVQVL